MKQFVLKLLFVFSLLLSVLIFCFFLNNISIKKLGFLKLEDSVSTLFMGDSHIQLALNDSIIKNSLNVAVGGESYFYTYNKLKGICEVNGNVDTVILGFAEQNFNKINDSKWIENGAQIRDWAAKYCYYMDLESYTTLFNIKKVDFLLGMIKIPQYSIKLVISLIKRDINFSGLYIGGFKYLDHDVLDRELEKIRSGNGIEDIILSDINIKYFNKIVNFCEKNNIKLILINTPIHKELYDYSCSNQEIFIDFYYKNFSDIEFFNFVNYEMPNECFGDLVHLSKKGAITFSNVLKNKLENK